MITAVELFLWNPFQCFKCISTTELDISSTETFREYCATNYFKQLTELLVLSVFVFFYFWYLEYFSLCFFEVQYANECFQPTTFVPTATITEREIKSTNRTQNIFSNFSSNKENCFPSKTLPTKVRTCPDYYWQWNLCLPHIKCSWKMSKYSNFLFKMHWKIQLITVSKVISTAKVSLKNVRILHLCDEQIVGLIKNFV